jgi:hypothetical protein
MRTLFDDVYRIELSLRFPRLRVNSQIATDLAVRESVVVIFDDVIHFSTASSCIYKSRAKKSLGLFAKGRTSNASASKFAHVCLSRDSLCASAGETAHTGNVLPNIGAPLCDASLNLFN